MKEEGHETCLFELSKVVKKLTRKENIRIQLTAWDQIWSTARVILEIGSSLVV